MDERTLEFLAPEEDRVAERIASLSSYTESATPGWTRRVFSDAYRSSREWIRGQMDQAGLETHVDPAGNIVGVLAGRDRSLPPIVTGSHTDTVYGGGRYDGIVGVIGGIEAAQVLASRDIKLRRDLIVVDFLGEEANNFGVSCIGSRYWSGSLDGEHLARVDPDTGLTLAETMGLFGLDPGALDTRVRPAAQHHAYIELHIEQGPKLERDKIEIGVVTAIAGIERLFASFIGRPDHAGTAVMEDRLDALTAAAEAILLIERTGCGENVTTTGQIVAEPGAFNVVPSGAKIWAEMRSVDPSWLTGSKRRVAEELATAAQQRGVELDMTWLNDQAPVPTAEPLRDLVAQAASELGLSSRPIPSGAGHDAAHLAGLGPAGMIFIPSEGGRSHVPEEFTASADIIRGVHTLTAALVKADSV